MTCHLAPSFLALPLLSWQVSALQLLFSCCVSALLIRVWLILSATRNSLCNSVSVRTLSTSLHPTSVSCAGRQQRSTLLWSFPHDLILGTCLCCVHPLHTSVMSHRPRVSAARNPRTNELDSHPAAFTVTVVLQGKQDETLGFVQDCV